MLFKFLFCSVLCYTHLLEVFSNDCFCDLTIENCDVNCCCDFDCSNDTSTFSTCIDKIEIDFESQSCILYNRSYDGNVSLPIVKSGLLCIVYDNFPERELFFDPPCLMTNSCFDSIKPFFSYVSPAVNQPIKSSYKNGDPVYMKSLSSNQVLIFSLPSSSISMTCQNYYPIEFLKSTKFKCTRSDNLINICLTVLDYNNYIQGFEIYAQPPSSADSQSLPVTIKECTVNGFLQNCVNAQFVASSQMCQNAVKSVTYLFIISQNTISSVTASFVLEDVEQDDFPALQTFESYFKMNQATFNSTFTRQGNPGYVTGAKLLAAMRVDDKTSVTNLSHPAELSLINPTGSGTCSEALLSPRRPLTFGEDSRTGCLLPVNNYCDDMVQLIPAILDGPSFSAFQGLGTVYVGTYGNSNISNLLFLEPTDWIKVLKQDYPTPQGHNQGCSNIALSSKYEILYARTGSLTNPQAKIVGISYSYITTQFFRFQCLSNMCRQTVEVFTSVSFIDVSQPPVSIMRQISGRVNYNETDFFSPFL